MFDDRLESALGNARALADLATETENEVRHLGCRKLRVAAAWADAHSDVDHRDGGMLVERLLPFGPAGCPPVAETCTGSLALAFRTSTQSAKGWITDALTVRHRLPRLWERVLTGDVYAWKAREIARATAHLSVFTARIVDKLLHDQVELVAWTRFVRILDATLLQVDPTTYGERQAKAAAQRDVKATQSSDGLRTLVARGTSGDVTMFLALVDAIAQALADEGDEDPYPVRKSKAIGIVAYPDRAQDLLSRGRHREDLIKDPWEQVDAHQADPTDPWADDLPAAGWETARYGNYHQPGLDEEWEMPGTVPTDDDEEQDEEVVGPADRAWYDEHTCPDARPDQNDQDGTDLIAMGTGEPADSPPSEPAARRSPRPSGLDLRPRNLDLSRSRPTVHLHLHVGDQTVRDGRGVVRTDHGPITVDQLRHFLGDSCPTIKVYPVYDPADTAAVDSYEIPVALRRAQSITNPASVFPFSPATGRMDLDHTAAYRPEGPPGQTSMVNLGPLTRSEHRAKTVGGWRAKQPDPGLYVWRSPEGQIAITTNQGTLVLGGSAYTHHLWRSAGKAPSKAALS
jgi:hypothetical protein